MSGRQWAGNTFGNGWMHRGLVFILRHVDVSVLYAFSAVFIVPFCLLFWRTGRRSSYSFFRKRLGYGRLKSARMTFSNHLNFARIVIDRFAMYAGRTFEMEVEGLEHFNRLAAGKEGFLHLSSHIGNYEMAGYTLVSENKVINAVVFSGEKESVMKSRGDMFSRTNIRMITIREDMSHLFEIDNAFVGGDIVSFPSDRYLPGSRTLGCRIFGADASFPQGPFSVATMRGLEVLAVNVMKAGRKKYVIYVTPLHYDRTLSRREQMQQLLEAYAGEMEKRVRQYPGQWFNFFDFWK